MTTLYYLQHYWWAIISLLGAILVFLLFVQGGQSLLFGTARNENDRTLLLNTFGHKWEMTFTTLVTFGGATFASFPLFYSTSFGGAYWLWMSILLLFVIQAVSYEYRGKVGNLLGARTYEIFLFLNGVFGSILLGVAVGMFFTGGAFMMDKMNITDISRPTISYWVNNWQGLDAIANPFNLLLGIGVFLAGRTLGLQYTIAQIEEPGLIKRCKSQIRVTGIAFILGFVVILIYLFSLSGYEVDPLTNKFLKVDNKFFVNMIELIWPSITLLIGVLLVVLGIGRTILNKIRYSFYITGAGVVLAVWSILICAGFNNTAYYVSTVNLHSSLTIYNSSSSEFTLKVMAYASLAIPFVIAYISYVWRALIRKKTSTEDLKEEDTHLY